MDEKLRILMQNENLSASRLAEILEIQPAAISHILKGRNKPSFDLICKIVKRFPQINPHWLLGDDEDIYAASATAAAATTTSSGATLFSQADEYSTTSEKSNSATPQANVPIPTLSRSDIEKIIIVYRDQTFEELRPKC